MTAPAAHTPLFPVGPTPPSLAPGPGGRTGIVAVPAQAPGTDRDVAGITGRQEVRTGQPAPIVTPHAHKAQPGQAHRAAAEAQQDAGRMLQVNGAPLHVRDDGDGVPLVFVHGWSTSGGFFRKQTAELSRTCRVVAPDLRGHGRSAPAGGGHTVANYAADIAEVIRQLDLERPVLVGWSMGAFIAYELLKQHGSGNVRGLVVVDQGPTDFAFPDYPLGFFTLEGLLDCAYQLQNDQVQFIQDFLPAWLSAPSADDIDWMVDEMMAVSPLTATASLFDQSIRDYRSFLPEISVPTLLAFGSDDKLSNPENGPFTQTLIPDSSLVMFEKSSHLPFYEEPGKFNQALLDFVGSLPR